MLLQSGLIANVKLHFFSLRTGSQRYLKIESIMRISGLDLQQVIHLHFCLFPTAKWIIGPRYGRATSAFSAIL